MSGVPLTILNITIAVFLWALVGGSESNLVETEVPVDDVTLGMAVPRNQIIVDEPDPATISIEDPRPFSSLR